NSVCSENISGSSGGSSSGSSGGCSVAPDSWENSIMHWCDMDCGAECELDKDCNDNDVSTKDTCDGGCACTHDVIVCSNDTECDDGIYCNGIESCINESCSAGTSIDCSLYAVNISKCDYDPDNNSETIDYFAFNSVCIEEKSTCSLIPQNWRNLFMHWCDFECGAGCENSLDCPVTECKQLSGCYNGSYIEYFDIINSCSNDCSCENASCETYNITFTDIDNDGFDARCGDCDDTSAATNPNATEICNGADDNCDGQIDEGCPVTNTKSRRSGGSGSSYTLSNYSIINETIPNNETILPAANMTISNTNTLEDNNDSSNESDTYITAGTAVVKEVESQTPANATDAKDTNSITGNVVGNSQDNIFKSGWIFGGILLIIILGLFGLYYWKKSKNGII
ncbi:MAG: putative metal-binding motif-containing protein, partial [Candidatus Woesearchaeota archaeon]